MKTPLCSSAAAALGKAQANIVVYGHSHVPNLEVSDGVLMINPGSAGPRRFSLPVSCALLRLSPTSPAQVEFLDLGNSGKPLTFKAISCGRASSVEKQLGSF